MRVASIAAAFVAAAALFCKIDPAAADMLEDAPAEPTLLYFSGLDLWRQGGFLHGGLLWSPRGLEQEGFTLKFMVGSGAYRYLSGALNNTEVIGNQFSGSVMPGWRFKRAGFEVTTFAGPDFQDHRLSPDDPTNKIRGSHAGLRSGFDLWHEPTRTTMMALDASVSSIGGSYTAHGALGWRAFDRVYLGPEAAAQASDNYRQYRFGFHMTGLKTEKFEITAALGSARDSSRHQGVYGRLSLVARR